MDNDGLVSTDKLFSRMPLSSMENSLQSQEVSNTQESKNRAPDIDEPSIDLHKPDSQSSRTHPPNFLEPRINLEGPSSTVYFHKKRKREPSSHSETQSDENISSNGGSSRKGLDDSNVCFGLIHNIQTKILHTTALENLGQNLASADSDNELPIRLRFQPENAIIFVNTAAAVDEADPATDFAILNEKTSQVLCQMKNLGCRFDTSPSMESSGDVSTEKQIYRYIDVIVAGPKDISDTIGTLLSTKKIYLQHPEMKQLMQYAEYENPHFLRFDNVPRRLIMDSEEPNASHFDMVYSLDMDWDVKHDMRFQPKLQNKVTKILNSLTRCRNLKKIEADLRIITPLLPHQAEALDFIAQREFGPIPDEYSLWTSQIYGAQTCYQHKISGCKLGDIPVEYGGGILADDMGLGKTLTILASIMQTSKEAKAFCDSPPQNLAHDASPKDKIRSRATIVIVQTSLLIDGWIEEIYKHCSGYVNVNIYHGRGRETNREVLADVDIVLSTYDTVCVELLDPESPVYGIEWFRVVLDEAHRIRNIKTKLFRAMSQISAKIRWCLTGTPIQNSLDDLAALVSFIRSSPLDDLSVFRKHIITPLLKEQDEGAINLRTLLDSICLRRTKKLLNLPPVVDIYRSVHFSIEEKFLYDSIRQEEIQAVKQQDSQARNKKGYFGIFQLQLQLRRLCNHGTFLKRCSSISQTDTQFDPEQAFGLLQENKDSRCHYCDVEIAGLEPDVTCRGRFTTCGHLLCFGCVSRYKDALISAEDNSYSSCSICNQMVVSDACFADEVRGIRKAHSLPVSSRFESTGIASKIRELLKDISQNQAEGKSIIFSCWTTSLDLVGLHLKLYGLPFERIDGSCTHVQRNAILRRYNTEEKTRILIMTTGTGAEGLNLTIANCVYILEPQWNPMVESQAIARVQRIGQTRDIRIFRYIVEDTVEKGIQARQARKLNYAKVGWTSDQLGPP